VTAPSNSHEGISSQYVRPPRIDGPFVSIVIPAYNHADHVAHAIDSVLAQDYPRIELIVLDDGSTDGTRAILERYSGRIQWESHKNMGQAATLNKGWARCHGEILSYLSADDRLLPHAVSAAMRVLTERDKVTMTYCDFHLIDEAGRRVRTVRAPDFDYYKMVVHTVCMPGPGVFFRRSAWSRAGGWNTDLRQWPDYDYWLRLGLQGPFERIAEPCAEFRVHGNSQTYSPVSFDRADEPVRILRGYYEAPHDLPAHIRSSKPLAMSSAALASAQLHFRAGRLAPGFSRLVLALRTQWRVVLEPGAWRVVAHGLFSRPLIKIRMALQRLD
jgi:glycosyltransferase involved in cell wall biosynthesis